MLKDDKYAVWYVLERDYPEFMEEARLLDQLSRTDKILCTKQLTKMYRMIKKLIPEVYMDGMEYRLYNAMLAIVTSAEERLLGSQIIDAYPSFIYDKRHYLDHNIDHYSSHQQLLDELVYSIRKRLVTSWNKSRDLISLDLTDKCRLATSTLVKSSKNMGIGVEKVCIHPGYNEKAALYNGDGFHYFNLVQIDDKKYIVDCSYAQFFYRGRNNLERLGLLDLSGCYPGRFMLLTDERKKVAEQLLTKGWIEATPDNMKNYLDGFTLMYRNGLYYENMGKADYSVDYSYDDYMNFLFGDDDQVKHEGREFLGYQKRQLKNPEFRFEK